MLKSNSQDHIQDGRRPFQDSPRKVGTSSRGPPRLAYLPCSTSGSISNWSVANPSISKYSTTSGTSRVAG